MLCSSNNFISMAAVDTGVSATERRLPFSLKAPLKLKHHEETRQMHVINQILACYFL